LFGDRFCIFWWRLFWLVLALGLNNKSSKTSSKKSSYLDP
jgi:hypothetical protein